MEPARAARVIRWDEPVTVSSESSSSATAAAAAAAAAAPGATPVFASRNALVTSTSWRELVTREGKKYYFNSTTQKTVWEQPEEYRLYLLYRDNLESGAVGVSAATAAAVPSSSAADEQFWQVLRDRQVTGQWSWEEALRAIITHPNYKCIPTLHERRASFARFCTAWEAEAALDAQLQIVARKEAFKAMLAADPAVGPNAAWQECVDKFHAHPAFTAVPSNRERHELFDEHVAELRRNQAQELAALRRKNLDSFRAWLVETIPDVEHARWQSLKARALEQLRRYEHLEPVDALLVFEDVFDALVRKYEAKREAKRLEEFESEARAKKSITVQLERTVSSAFAASFPQVLESLSAEDVKALAYPRFHLASHPLNLFKDALAARRSAFLKEYARFHQYCRERYGSEPLPRAWAKLDFFTTDLRAKFPAAFLGDVHARLYPVKDEKTCIAEYKQLLKHWSTPAISLASAWRDVREMLKGEPEFAALAEELRETYFYKYLKYLKSKQ